LFFLTFSPVFQNLYINPKTDKSLDPSSTEQVRKGATPPRR
jgi:hypothetical protein